MPISSDPSAGVYRLDTPESSLFFVVHDGYLFQPWWGPRCGDLPPSRYADLLDIIPRSPPAPGCLWSPGSTPMALPVAGSGDFRNPALHIVYQDGTTASRLEFAGAEILTGLRGPAGLPQIALESGETGSTLALRLADRFRKIEAELRVSIVEGHNAFCTSVRILNRGTEDCHIRTAASACMNLPAASYDQITLSGAWARERRIDRLAASRGIRTIGSDCGSSGHNFNPFTAIAEKNATEKTGNVYGFSLVWSGDFTITAETDTDDALRVSAAAGNRDFNWKLGPGESFETPEAVLVFSSEGLGGMSRTYHRLYRKNLCISPWKNKPRPVLSNSWEAAYFSFNQEKIERLMTASAGLGIELFVLDDGWFGKRDSDRTSLGDWEPNREKLPDGLDGLASNASRLGMKFGLWFEPEMVSPDSDLYRAHPDWAVHIAGRKPQESRNQLVLDMSRSEVRAYITETISRILESADIQYVKWDYNRPMTDIESTDLPADRQGEFTHRFILGSWSVMRTLIDRFPHILFEGCAAGGGRFDPGILHFMPQIWTSDDTDAKERLAIQYGTSLVYPFSAISAHVSASPNHQCGRITPFAFRGAVAMTGAFGYELDLTGITETEREQAKGQILNWKKREELIREGDLWRLLSPFEGNETAWIFVSPDKKDALLCWYRELNRPNTGPARLKLDGLENGFHYRVADFELSADCTSSSGFPAADRVYCGADLSGPGVPLPATASDYSFMIVRFSVS